MFFDKSTPNTSTLKFWGKIKECKTVE